MKLSTHDALCDFVQMKLNGYRFIVVSNREPFQHRHVRGGIECIQPASGMASALDRVARACGGLWIAHGSGNADRQTADVFGRIAVPPGRPEYTLRRVWLSKEEEAGHYAGLSNQALWPLCHTTFTRPLYDASHWRMYRRVNQALPMPCSKRPGMSRSGFYSGLSFCLIAPDAPKRQPQVGHRSVLAHSMAQSRNAQHFSLARGNAGWIARK